MTERVRIAISDELYQRLRQASQRSSSARRRGASKRRLLELALAPVIGGTPSRSDRATLWVTSPLYDRLGAEAARLGCSVSQLVEQALADLELGDEA